MAPVIDMSDQNAWDDSVLINSWNDAVAEYKKYHSIHTSGKRLEDVLTEEELEALRGDHGNLIEDAETQGSALVNSAAEQVDTGTTHTDSMEETTIGQQEQSQPPNTARSALQIGDHVVSMPHTLLGSVQDDNLRNLMMSWYYAGYYTGLHAGQQQISRDTAPNQ